MTPQDVKDWLAIPAIPLYILLLRERKKASHNLQDHMEVVKKARVGTLHIQPIQVSSELEAFITLVNASTPKRVLEIGTARGGTLYLLAQAAAADATLISLDLPGGQFGKGYSSLKVPLFRSFANPGQTIHFVRADSHGESTLETVINLLAGKPLDILFVDGDHTYEGVAQDFEMYSPLVKDGGMIAFHDIVDGPSHRVGGVPRFWQQVKQRHRFQEIVESWD